MPDDRNGSPPLQGRIIPLFGDRGVPHRAAPHAPQNAPGGATQRDIGRRRVRPGRDFLKYLPAGEARQRGMVAVVAACFMFTFLGFALFGALQQRMVTPLGIGSYLLLELAIEFWPQLWVLGVVHNLFLAGISAAFIAAVTTANNDPPCDPRMDSVYVWRRAMPFVFPEFGLVLSVLTFAWYLHDCGYPILAAVVASNGVAMLLHLVARLFVPIVRQYVVVEFDLLKEGLGNRLIIGGGFRGIRHGAVYVPHGRFRKAECMTGPSPFEWAFGLASLRIYYVDENGQSQRIRVYAFGSVAMVEHVAQVLNGKWRLGLSEQSLIFPPNHPLRAGSFARPAGTPT